MRNTSRSGAPPAPSPKDRAVLRSVSNALAIKAYTPLTLTEPGRVREELERIRATGCAFDKEEFAVGLRCIAAPVRDHTGQVAASLGLACPAVRLPEGRAAPLAALVREAALSASAAMGFREPRA